MPLQTRLIHTIGYRIRIMHFWGEPGVCRSSRHSADRTFPEITPDIKPVSFSDFKDEDYPTHCKYCGAPVEGKTDRSIAHDNVWNTESGNQEPGCMWYVPWFFDPAKDYIKVLEQSRFSIYYKQNHAMNRPPICVKCPDGRDWMIDMKSSNGEGWKVTGEPPFITCSPSIDTGTYHGFLQNGVFTDDLEGRKY